MRRAVLAALLVLGACGGGGEDDDGASSSTTTTAAAVEDGTTSTTVEEEDATSGSTARTEVPSAPTSTEVPAATAGSAAPAPMTPGTYHYRQRGSGSAGPQSFEVPPEGTAVVDAAAGDGTQVVHRYVDPEGEPADTTLRFGDDGIFILSTMMRQGGMAITCTFDPPVAAPPWPPTTGATTTGSGDCEMFSVKVELRITGQTPVTVGDQRFDAWVVETTITTYGDVESTTHQTDHFVEALRMSAHTESSTEGRFGQLRFSGTSVSDLVSAVPDP
jgi:hypothetical protein